MLFSYHFATTTLLFIGNCATKLDNIIQIFKISDNYLPLPTNIADTGSNNFSVSATIKLKI